MTRLFGEGLPITVVDGNDRLVAFRWQAGTHPVEHIAHYWRVDLDWWRRRTARDYFRLVTTTGLFVEIATIPARQLHPKLVEP